LQAAGLVVVQVPVLVAALSSTHRAGVLQVGPLVVSQPASSPAGATQIPSRVPEPRWQNAPAVQSITPPSMFPQAKVAAAVATRSQTRPSGTLQ